MRVANPQVMRAADMNVAVARPVAAQAVTTRSCTPQHGGRYSAAAAVCSRHRANRSGSLAATIVAAGNSR